VLSTSRNYSGGHQPVKPLLADDAFPVDTDVEALFDPASGYWDDLRNWDAADYAWKCRVDLLCQDLKIPLAEQPAFRKKYDISKGYMTLEWVLPSPPPAHTFNEQPIIKEYTTQPPESPSFAWLCEQLLDEVWQSKQVTDQHKKTLDNLCRGFLVPGPVRPYLSELLNFYARREVPKLLDFDPDVHHPHGTDNLTEEEVAIGVAYSHLTAPPEALRVLGIGPMPGNTVPHVGTPHERAQGLGYNGPLPVPDEYEQQKYYKHLPHEHADHGHAHDHGHGHHHHEEPKQVEGFVTRQLRQIYEKLERVAENQKRK
jgi:hypothetical protein